MKIRITNRPHKLIHAIKSVRHAAGLSLMEAKGAVDRSEWFEIKHATPREILEDLSDAGAVVETKEERVRIREGWHGAGQEGLRLGPDVFTQQEWTPVLWDGEEDPDWHKASGLERA